MGHQLDVQVLDEDGDPVAGVRVRVDIAGLWSGGTLEERTGEDGHASFETAGD